MPAGRGAVMGWPAATLRACRYKSASRVSKVSAKFRTTTFSFWPGMPGKFVGSAKLPRGVGDGLAGGVGSAAAAAAAGEERRCRRAESRRCHAGQKDTPTDRVVQKVIGHEVSSFSTKCIYSQDAFFHENFLRESVRNEAGWGSRASKLSRRDPLAYRACRPCPLGRFDYTAKTTESSKNTRSSWHTFSEAKEKKKENTSSGVEKSGACIGSPC